MCIRMLQILNSGRIYKVSELADLLETNPRNIIEYKKELDEIVYDSFGGSGFYIENIPGRYGGYRLNGNVSIPALQLLLEEKEALIESYNYVLAKKDFIKKKEFISAFSKVLSNIEIEENDKKIKITSIDAYQLTMSESDIQERYRFIEKAIESKRQIEIRYLSLKNGEKTHILDPYHLFLYNNAWFFFAWNPEVGEVWYFKLNRIKAFKLLDKKFTVYKYFRVEDYFDGVNFKKYSTSTHIKFVATGTRALMIKERQYGQNQVVTDNNDGSITVEMDMGNEDQILSFILQGKSEIKLLEPTELVEKVKLELDKISALYK